MYDDMRRGLTVDTKQIMQLSPNGEHDCPPETDMDHLRNNAPAAPAAVAARAFWARAERDPRGLVKDFVDSTIVLCTAF